MVSILGRSLRLAVFLCLAVTGFLALRITVRPSLDWIDDFLGMWWRLGTDVVLLCGGWGASGSVGEAVSRWRDFSWGPWSLVEGGFWASLLDWFMVAVRAMVVLLGFSLILLGCGRLCWGGAAGNRSRAVFRGVAADLSSTRFLVVAGLAFLLIFVWFRDSLTRMDPQVFRHYLQAWCYRGSFSSTRDFPWSDLVELGMVWGFPESVWGLLGYGAVALVAPPRVVMELSLPWYLACSALWWFGGLFLGVYLWRRWDLVTGRWTGRLAGLLVRRKATRSVAGVPVVVADRGAVAARGGLAPRPESWIVGQDEVLDRIWAVLQASRLGVRVRTGRPLAVFLFLGPTGVGKTETARWIARVMYGSEDRMVRVNLQEHDNEASAWSLLGSPRGYVGSDQGGIVTRALEREPDSVLLLDEIEKGHPALVDLFMTAFDEGVLQDKSSGREVSLSRCVVVMTSNLLSERWRELRGRSGEELRDLLSAREGFKPELLSRIDEILVFSGLSRGDLEEIVRRRLGVLAGRLRDGGLRGGLEWRDEVVDRVLAELDDGRYGARQVDRVLERLVVDTVLAHGSGRGGLGSGRMYLYVREDGTMAVTSSRREWRAAPRWRLPSWSQALASRRNLLRERVFGQDHVLEVIERHALAAAKGLRISSDRPLLSLLMLGPTGVGKTETAKALAGMVYGDDGRLVRLDMAEFASPESAWRLFGAPRGFRGSEAGGELTRGVLAHTGRCVVLFDEVEKAHPSIWDPLMTVFDEGYLQEAGTGRKVSFRDAVVVMTSNLLAGRAEELVRADDETLKETLVSTGAFRREFLGRLDRVVVFRPLGLEALERIVEVRLGRLARDTGTRLGLKVSWEDDVRRLLAERCLGSGFGVRSLDRLVADLVLLSLSDFVDAQGGRDVVGGMEARLVRDGEGVKVVPL